MFKPSEAYPAGRYWGGANSASMTVWHDGATVKLEWSDGKYLTEFFDCKAEAEAFLKRLGFKA